MKNEGIIAAAGTCTGLILMIFSASWGQSLADSWLIANGGHAETNTYLMKRDILYSLFFTSGSILFAGGIVFSILLYVLQIALKRR